MHYYKIIVRSNSYRNSEPLVYSHANILTRGQLVLVQLRSKSVTGIVKDSTKKPVFAVKNIEAILDYPPLTQQFIDIIYWLARFYWAPLSLVAQHVIPSNIFVKPKQAEISKQKRLPLQKLTKNQEKAYQALVQAKSTSIIHGDTGSGKTRLYLELVKDCLSKGSSAIILTPEISLTSQLLDTFKDHFGEMVVVTHSSLTASQRRNIWLNALSSDKPMVIVGPRSAIFSPLKNIGLIVVDECHESAYKNERTPTYNTIRVASKLGESYKCKVVFGSATPNVVDYYLAQSKNVPIVRLKEKAIQSNTKTKIDIVDMKKLSKKESSSLLSNELISAIASALSKKEQSLLFLNRRGTARSILCQSCGWQALCPNCNVHLTFHGDKHTLVCHICNFSSGAPSSCPDCKNTDIVFKGIGTKALVDNLQNIFPDAKIGRYDKDTTKLDQFHNQYKNINDGLVDILVGTQILVKGLDLPRLSVVGMILAENSLQFPDYTSTERTYQLINQLVGRVGRGHRDGHAVIQTFNSQNPFLNNAVLGNWDTFLLNELVERKQFNFPPYVNILKVKIKASSKKTILRLASEFIGKIEKLNLGVTIHGPTPCYVEKSGTKLNWQIIIKAKKRGDLITIANMAPASFGLDFDPTSIL